MTFRILDGFRAIAGDYDVALIDLWGVVHNGREPYPGVLDCLAGMRAAGIRRVLLSNAPRRADAVRDQIAGFGVPPDAYDAIFSSGEMTFLALAAGLPQLKDARKCFYLGPEKDRHLLEGQAYASVDRIADADFVLVAGLRDDTCETAASYEAELAGIRACGLTMVCANPDLTVMRGETTAFCAGALAAAYEALGGEVVYFGKPHAAAYEACLRGTGTPPARVVAIGDSPRTDLAGAAAFGIASVFVAGGLHARDVGMPPDARRLASFFASQEVEPDYVLPRLNW